MISVKYSKPVMYGFLALGVILLALGGLLMLLTGAVQIGVISGAMLVVFAALGLNNPLLVLEGDELQARNLLGMTLKRHPVDELRVETDSKGNQRLVRLKPSGKPQQVMRARTVFFDRKDTEAMMAAFSARAFSA